LGYNKTTIVALIFITILERSTFGLSDLESAEVVILLRVFVKPELLLPFESIGVADVSIDKHVDDLSVVDIHNDQSSESFSGHGIQGFFIDDVNINIDFLLVHLFSLFKSLLVALHGSTESKPNFLGPVELSHTNQNLTGSFLDLRKELASLILGSLISSTITQPFLE
jgi:hypothetical protein